MGLRRQNRRSAPVDTAINPLWLHAVDHETIVFALHHSVGRLSVQAMEQRDRNPTVAGSHVSYPSTNNDDSGVSVDREGRLWARQDFGISDGKGNDNLGGVVVYDWEQYRDSNSFQRTRQYDVPTYSESGAPEPVDYWLAVGDNYLYTFYYDNGAQDDVATVDTDERYRIARYAVDAGLVFDPATAHYQRPPNMGRIEPENERQEGDAELVDVKFQWEHRSRIVEGHTVMEYRYRSQATGEVGPVLVSADSTEHTIRGLPRSNYELLLEFRYRWYNPDSASDHILVKNPPSANDDECAEENEDEFDNNNVPLGDDRDDRIDASEDADTTRPGCAFYVDPGETRFSNWAEVRVNLTGPLTGVPDASIEIEPYTGLVAATADLLLVMGVEPDGIGPLSHTLTVFGWLILATAVAAGAYVVTGMKTGSAYLATFLWLAIWAGLGPFIAMIPWAMAYLPVAGLLLLGGTLALKRGRM